MNILQKEGRGETTWNELIILFEKSEGRVTAEFIKIEKKI